jgi:hypothetical protein
MHLGDEKAERHRVSEDERNRERERGRGGITMHAGNKRQRYSEDARETANWMVEKIEDQRERPQKARKKET